jgi:hypothetical protein
LRSASCCVSPAAEAVVATAQVSQSPLGRAKPAGAVEA